MVPLALVAALALQAESWGNAHGPIPALAPSVAGRLKAATALVIVRGATGSAFVIGPYRNRVLLVTNAHVLVPPRGMNPWGEEVVFDAGTPAESRRIKAEVLGRDEAADLALLAVPAQARMRPSLAVATRCDSLPPQPIYAAGFPLGFSLAAGAAMPAATLSPGRIAARRAPDGALALDVGLNPGNSGGPVVTPDGIVVGVAVAHVRGSERSWAIPCGPIQRLVERAAPGFELDLRPLPVASAPAHAKPSPPPSEVAPVAAPSRAAPPASVPERGPERETAGIARLMASGGRGTGIAVARRGDTLFLATADTSMFRVRIGDRVDVWFRGDTAPRRGRYLTDADGLSLVEVPGAASATRQPYGFSKRLPRETEPVQVRGFHPSSNERDFDVRVVDGNVSSLRRQGDATLLQLDFGVDGGVLGGLVTDSEGKFTAIAPRRAIGTNVCIAIPGELVEDAARAACGPEAVPALKRRARSVPPSVEAQYELGVAQLGTEAGRAKDAASAMGALDSACAAGYGEACYALFAIHANGQLVPFDYDRALAYARKACTFGKGCWDLWKKFGECPQ